MHWEDEYKKNKKLWGEGPSELAQAAVDYIRKSGRGDDSLSVLDVGCGYGRDAFYYSANLDCSILGIDLSEKAIEIASNAAAEKHIERIGFRCRDFAHLEESEYDAVCASNLYQLLMPKERESLRRTVMRTLKPGGLFFLSTLSLTDPEHHGKGTPIPEEPNSFSFEHRIYLHFCKRKELAEDFSFLDIKELYEQEYHEPRATGEAHHHVSWILIGRRINH